jgi:hypothetical protein
VVLFCFEIVKLLKINENQTPAKSMSLNKFMHPRNIYKVPPDFTSLAVAFPEFLAVSSVVIFVLKQTFFSQF